MKFKDFKSHFQFNRQERSGIFFLLMTIVLLQLGYFLWRTFSTEDQEDILKVDTNIQAQIDALKEKVLQKDSVKIYPFNPNFITDYKGYTLGMSVDEIDRLHDFRKTDEYVNSAAEFQEVTLISDSLLQIIAPYFKFPEWTQTDKRSTIGSGRLKADFKNVPSSTVSNDALFDLNSASAEDLKSIAGIGEKLSARIIKFRNRLGGFVADKQLYHVYGLDPEVVERALKKFKVVKKPTIISIEINNATVQELTKLVYINYDLASKIVEYRDTNGEIRSFNELTTIDGFPSEKLDIIQLYLSLD